MSCIDNLINGEIPKLGQTCKIYSILNTIWAFQYLNMSGV